MPVELRETLDVSRRVVKEGDTGILVQARPRERHGHGYRGGQNPIPEVLKWLRSYADEYWKARNPEAIEETEVKATDAEATPMTDAEATPIVDTEATPVTDTEATSIADTEENTETNAESTPKTEDETTPKKEAESTPLANRLAGSDKKKSPVQFVARDLNLDNNTLVFVSTNLVNIPDYLLYVFDTMAASLGERRTKYPFRAMPVIGMSIPRPCEMEAMVLPLLEEIIGDQKAHRFSISFNGSMDADNLTQKEAGNMLRDFIWSVNPNCVQCSKYQDFAFVLDIIKPFFCFGYLLEFIKLRRYRSQPMLKLGYDLSGEGEDSDDDISDDPTLDEEADRNRKMKIKRKRGAEKAGIVGENGDTKQAKDESVNGKDRHEHAGSDNEDDD